MKQFEILEKSKQLLKRVLFRTLTRRTLDYHIENILKQYARGKVLDIGSLDSPYRQFIKSDQYEILDVVAREGVNYVQDIHKTNFVDATFDTLIATEVLEHLYHPHLAVAEMYRILKVGGYLVASTRFIYCYHGEPYDYFRFTRHGLTYLFRDFQQVTIIPLGGTCEAIVDLITTRSNWLKLARIVNFLFDVRKVNQKSKAPLGFIIVAQKRL